MAPRQLKCTQQQSGRTVIHFSTRQRWRLNSLLQFGFSDSTSSKTGHPKSPTSHSHLTTGKLSATNPRPPHLNFEILNSKFFANLCIEIISIYAIFSTFKCFIISISENQYKDTNQNSYIRCFTCLNACCWLSRCFSLFHYQTIRILTFSVASKHRLVIEAQIDST